MRSTVIALAALLSGFSLLGEVRIGSTAVPELRVGPTVIAAAVRGAVPVYSAAPPVTDYTDGLVAWYKFDDNAASTVVASSVPGVPDMVASLNTSVRHVAGVNGGAIRLQDSGADRFCMYLDNAAQYLPMGRKARTVSMWLKWLSNANADSFGYLWHFPGAAANYQMFGMRTQGGGQSTAANLTAGAYYLDLNSNAMLTPQNQWHLVTLVYDGAGLISLYQDAVQVASASTWMALNTVASTGWYSKLVVGDDLGDTYGHRDFEGDIDDFRIYDRALSQDQIRTVYNHGVGAEAIPLDGFWNEVPRLAWYKFEDDAASTAVIESVAGRNGILNGFIGMTPANTDTATSADGVVGRAFRLTTTSGVMARGAGIAPSAPPFTYACWVKYYSLPPQGANLMGGIWTNPGQTSDYGDGFALGLDQTTGQPWFTVYGDDWSVQSSKAVPMGSWHFLVATVAADRLVTIYLDGGEVVASYKTAGSLSTWAEITGNMGMGIGSLYCPGWSNDWSIRYNGLIDECQIWDQCLTQGQVESLYQSYTAPVFNEVPAIWYKCDDSAESATVVNSGTAVNADGTALCTDLTPYANTADITTPGTVDGALAFAGNAHVEGSDAAKAIMSTEHFTLSMFTKSSASDLDMVVDARNWTDGRTYFLCRQGAHYLQSYTRSGDQPWRVAALPSEAIYGWLHVTLVRDGTLLITYANGTEVFRETLSNGAMLVELLALGGSWDVQNHANTLDDIRLYSRAFSADEVASLYGSYDPDRNAAIHGLRAWWKLDDWASNNRIWDSSTNRIHGTWPAATAAAVAYPAPQYSGLNFDSTHAANMGQGLVMGDRTKPFSVSAWVKPAVNPDYQIIVGNNETAHTDPGWSFFLAGGNIYFRLNAGTSAGANELQVYGENYTVSGAWNLVIVTYTGMPDASQVQMYLNGSPVTALGVNFDTLTSDFTGAGDTVIGATPSGAYPFTGSIDDVRVYDHVLSAQELQQLYTRYVPAAAPPPPASVTITFDPTMSGTADYYTGQYTVGQAYGSLPQAYHQYPDDNEFVCWRDGSWNAVGTSSTVPGADATLTADYAAKYAIYVYPGNGSDWYTVKLAAGHLYSEISQPQPPTDHHFSYWYSSNFGNIGDGSGTYTGGGDTITAYYEATGGTVHFEPAGGSMDPTAYSTSNDGYVGDVMGWSWPTPTAPYADYPAYYSFSGWYTDWNGGGSSADLWTWLGGESSITYYAYWIWYSGE